MISAVVLEKKPQLQTEKWTFRNYNIDNIYGTHTGMYGCGSLLRERFISELKLVQKKKKKLFVTKINEERRPEKNKDEICF